MLNTFSFIHATPQRRSIICNDIGTEDVHCLDCIWIVQFILQLTIYVLMNSVSGSRGLKRVNYPV